jgi:hypothetical protein
MLPSCQLLKLRYYFDDYGCLRCGKVQARYGSNGFCWACSRTVSARLIYALKRRFRKLGASIRRHPIENLLATLAVAHSLRPEEIAREARLRQDRVARRALKATNKKD